MANLSNLIVSGASRLLNTLYCKDIEIDGTLHGNFTVSSPIISSVSTGSHINGAKGTAIINSTASAGFNMLFRQKSTNGVFNAGVWTDRYCFFYVADSLITAGTNKYTKYLSLLDESGNSSFPGTVTALNFSGTISASNVTQDSTHRFITDVCKSITDWNAATTNGFYMGSGAANAPSNTWYFGRVLANSTNYLYQEVYAFTTSADAKTIPKYIRARVDGTWSAWTNVTVAKAVPADAKFTDTIYTHSTASGYKHIPSGGSSGQFLKWSANGTAVWAADNNTTYSVFKAATSSAAGGSGLVPAPAAGAQTRYLRGDGTWQVPPDTKYTHPNSGVTAGTYRSITVNTQGHVTAGTNPTTLAGYGITDAAAKTHTHSYLPLSGGTLTGRLTGNGKSTFPSTAGTWVSGMTLTNPSIGISTQQTQSSYHPYFGVKTYSGHVVNIGGLGDNFGFYGYYANRTANGTDWSCIFNVATGAITATGTITAPSFNGTASKANVFTTARTINGTSFNGSANITTANWGTARTLTFGNTGKSINGSGNVAWTLSEIGAAPSTATRLLTATATAAGWSASAPYTQTISVSGITSSDTPIIGLSLPTNTTVANDKAIKKAYGCLSSAVTNNGSITLYCASKKPVTNFTIFIKGV